MAIRSTRERALQTLAYEAGGLLIATPVFALSFGTDGGESFRLMALLSLVMLLWSPVHNSLFDIVEWRLVRRVASDRPHWLRVGHAISHEATALVVTLPLLMWLGGLGFLAAILAEFGLTALYAAYAYVFHVFYDRLRPVVAGEGPSPGIEKESE
jgi:uncharacterized membrane protein